ESLSCPPRKRGKERTRGSRCPLPRSRGRVGVGAAGRRRQSSAPAARAPIPAFPRKRGKERNLRIALPLLRSRGKEPAPADRVAPCPQAREGADAQRCGRSEGEDVLDARHAFVAARAEALVEAEGQPAVAAQWRLGAHAQQAARLRRIG